MINSSANPKSDGPILQDAESPLSFPGGTEASQYLAGGALSATLVWK